MGLFLNCVKMEISADIINILRDFLRNRKQCSSCADVRSRVPQGLILEPLLFLIYINDLFYGLESECNLFTNDTFLFLVVHDISISASDLNDDLEKIGNWAFQWKMNFNLDPNKQGQEIIFCRKKTDALHSVVYFDNRPVNRSFFEKFDLSDSEILQQNDLSITKDLLFGSEKLKDDKTNVL